MNIVTLIAALLFASPPTDVICEPPPAPRRCEDVSPICASCGVWGPPWGVDCKVSAFGHGCAGFCGTGAGAGCTGSCW